MNSQLVLLFSNNTSTNVETNSATLNLPATETVYSVPFVNSTPANINTLPQDRRYPYIYDIASSQDTGRSQVNDKNIPTYIPLSKCTTSYIYATVDKSRKKKRSK